MCIIIKEKLKNEKNLINDLLFFKKKNLLDSNHKVSKIYCLARRPQKIKSMGF